MKKRISLKLGKKKLIVFITILGISIISLGIFLNLPKILGTEIKPPVPQDFTASNFKAKPDGTLIHTYTVQGIQKTQNYINQKTIPGSKAYAGGRSFWMGPNTLFLYEMDSPEIHKNLRAKGYKPQESKYFLIINKYGTEYKTEGIFFYSPCTNIRACGNAVSAGGNPYYFKALEFGPAGHDDIRTYDTSSEFYAYLNYVNSKKFTVYGLGSGETTNKCSISGTINIDYTGQELGDETGVQPWPQDEKINPLGRYYAQLWYKGPGSNTWENTKETADIDEKGVYKFDARERQIGKYLVTAIIIRGPHSRFQSTSIDSIEGLGEEKQEIDPSYLTYLEDWSDQEGFFGNSRIFELTKNCTSVTELNFTLKSIGIYRRVKSETSECEIQACNTKGICGEYGTGRYNPFNLKCIFCRIGCIILEAVGKFIEWTLEVLNKASGISQNIFAQKAYAVENVKSLSLQLKTEEKIIGGWKFSLATTDIIVIFALLAIAFANILKLNIDVYAVKKALPGLVIGIILANFSLLICRVIVDFASLLSNHFIYMAGGPGVVGGSLATLMFNATPTQLGGLVAVGGGLIALILAMLSSSTLFCLAIPVILLFLAIPGLIILTLAFLMYARLYVVWILTILSPLAFIVLGFPPTQQYFKTWWSWFLKWVFMAPIVYFNLGLAAYIGKTIIAPNVPSPGEIQQGLGWFGGWILGMIVLVKNLYIPFKIGGAIMNLWATKVGKPLAIGLDAMIGRVARGWSPYGLYKGTKEAFGAAWRRHEAGATGRGRVVGETLTAIPGALWATVRGGRGAGRQTLQQRAEEAQRRNAAQEIENIRQEYEVGLAAMNDQDLENSINNAIGARDFAAATAGLIQAGERGLANFDQLAQNYANTFHGRGVTANVALDIAQAASIHSSYGPVLSPVTIQNNQIVQKSEARLLQEMQQLLNRSLYNLRPEAQRRMIETMLDRLGQRFTTQGNRINPHSFALFAHLARAAASPGHDAYRQEIVNRVKQMNATLGDQFEQIVNNLRQAPQFDANQIRQALEEAGLIQEGYQQEPQ